MRELPVMCIACKDCGSVFHAVAMNKDYHNNPEANSDLLHELCEYAKDGHNISFRERDDFEFKICDHINKATNGPM